MDFFFLEVVWSRKIPDLLNDFFSTSHTSSLTFVGLSELWDVQTLLEMFRASLDRVWKSLG